jgi:predicted nucleic acid-binding protein
VWDVSSWDECKWGNDGDNLYEVIRDDLNKFRNKPNNIQDALIAETAIRNALVLVTNDKDLKNVAQKHGATVQDIRITKGSKV